MKFIFFTKTLWSEPPRIRHQLANMLLKYGHEVVFFEAPSYLLKQSKVSIKRRDDYQKLIFLKTKQLIHHQLRVFSLLVELNSCFEKGQIRKIIGKYSLIDEPVTIINFNYDYFFLKELFPDTPIITVINDDFVAQARLFNGKHVLNALAKTCGISDAVLSVSSPLVEQLKPFCSPILFLPWADSDYEKPSKNERDSVLLWATIGNFIDFYLLADIAIARPNVQFDLYGPIQKTANKSLVRLCQKFNNVTYFGVKSLSELRLEKYYASVLPYKAGKKEIEAVSLANKTLRLMSKGLPLVTHGMPNYLEHDAIYKCEGISSVLLALDECRTRFDDLQEEIVSFVANNTEDVRYLEFLQILDDKRV